MARRHAPNRPGALPIAVVALLVVTACAHTAPRTDLDMTTWSIAALDPETGAVGVSMASCVPETFGDAVAALVPGKGVAAVQAAWNLDNRNRVFELLQQGVSAEQVVYQTADAELDSMVGRRQYGVVTMNDGVLTSGYTGEENSDFAAHGGNTQWAVSVQGNTLVGQAVLVGAMNAFIADDPDGENELSDRLMRALEAGSAAGGDVRCNRDGVTSTAASAMILLARGDDPPYATETIGMSDQGTEAAPWLAISEHAPREGPNPIPEVRRRYDEWRADAYRGSGR